MRTDRATADPASAKHPPATPVLAAIVVETNEKPIQPAHSSDGASTSAAHEPSVSMRENSAALRRWS